MLILRKIIIIIIKMVHLFLWLIIGLSISVISVSLLLCSLYRYYQVLSGVGAHYREQEGSS